MSRSRHAATRPAASSRSLAAGRDVGAMELLRPPVHDERELLDEDVAHVGVEDLGHQQRRERAAPRSPGDPVPLADHDQPRAETT